MSDALFIRADASPTIGVGHVMRCLALAQAWQDQGGRVVFGSALLPEPLRQRLEREGFTVVEISAEVGSPTDVERTQQCAGAVQAAWIVADGYRFDADYLRALSAGGGRVLAIDDMAHQCAYPVDLLLNQNLSATPAMYRDKTDAHTELLLGPRFGLLRREFRLAQPSARPRANGARRVLVSCGGGDAKNMTAAVLRQLSRAPAANLDVVVLAGAANPHLAELRALAAELPFRCELRFNVENMAELMAWADVAIAAAGSTVWELASMRLPALIGAVEDNQIAGLAALAQIPFFRAALAEELITWDLGRELDALLARSAPLEAEIDAEGATRVVARLKRNAIYHGNLVAH
jgi:UDP-2,4-diacetamido-2,4,6-trideoxy-beta-L-altropyranose hydrolase